MTAELTSMLIFRPGQEPEARTVMLARQPSYFALRDLIVPLLDGANLEQVSVLYRERARDMFVDDCGRLKRLPRNSKATEIYRAATLARTKTDPETLPFIAGTAILFPDRRVWF